MKLAQIKYVYFIGIGGIGMSALARYFRRIGKDVSGYDKTPSQLTSELMSEGISICFDDAVSLIPKQFVSNSTLVVVTPAVPKDHKGWSYFKSNHYQIKKRSEVLGMITKDSFCFAVAGTHGKTTTSALLGHILYSAGVDVTAFVGGIVENYKTNLIGSGAAVTVVEADEFDRSFLHLYPDMSCVTSMDADHLDIYENAEAFEASFREFAAKTKNERLFIAAGLPLKGISVGVLQNADYTAYNIRVENGLYVFDAQLPTGVIPNISLSMPGHHNISNAMMALAMAHTYGISATSIVEAFKSFKGIRRRFSYQIRREDFVYIDDYAHHPTEIASIHQAVRELYPNKEIAVVFQPHLYSRTRDFAQGFAESLAVFDQIFLMEIYPARELPIPGINAAYLFDKISNPNKKLVSKDDLIPTLQKTDAQVVVTLGAGDIGTLVEPIKNALYEKN